MFLFERLFGIATYSYLLIAVCVLVAFSKINLKSLFRFYIASLCVMAFFYTPYETADLYRIFETMEWYSDMSFGDFFSTFVLTSSSPLPRVLYWFIGQFGINGLLPAVSCAISYSLIFSVVLKTQEKYSISRTNVALTLLLLMSSSMYISVVGGIRMMLSMSLVVFCFFRETVERKFKWYHVLLYIIAVFTHNMAFVIVAIRIISALFDKRNKNTNIILSFCAIVMAILMFWRFNYIILDVLSNVSHYLGGDTYSDAWEYLMGALFALLYVIVFVRFFLHERKTPAHKELISYNMGAVISAAIALGFFSVFSIFYRFIGHLVPLLSIPMLMICLQDSRDKTKVRGYRMSFSTFVFLITVVIFAISALRGSLSSLKFFVL